MSIFDKDGNKSYKEYELSTESREKITKGILEGINIETATSKSELDVRRIEKMKKENKYAELIKKLAVASVSLIATGGIIFGVTKYNDKKDVNVSKNTVVTESTKQVEEKQTEEKQTEEKQTEEKQVEEKQEDEKIKSMSVMKYEDGEDLNYYKVVEDGEVRDTIDINGYSVVSENEYIRGGVDTYEKFYIIEKSSDKKIEIPYLTRWGYSDMYTNGRYIYYLEDYLFKFDMETKECTYFDIHKDKQMVHEGNLVIAPSGPVAPYNSFEYNDYPYNSYPYDSFKKMNRNLQMKAIRNGIIYFNLETGEEIETGEEFEHGDQTNLNCYIYSYNICDGELKLDKDDMKIVSIDGDYVVIYRPHGHEYTYDEDESNDSNNIIESFVYRFTDGGLEEIVSMGEYSQKCFEVKLPKDNKIYFESYKNHDMNKDGYEKEFTIVTFDKTTENVEEIATINVDDLVKDFTWYWLKKVGKDYCIISIRKEKDNSYTDYKFKYTYATKKAEEITK